MKKNIGLLLTLVLGLALGFAVASGVKVARWFSDGPDPKSITAASLQAVREQNRLTAFAARFVAVVTSEQSRFGLSAKKTMIMPGLVRYEIDLARLGAEDLAWDAATNMLSITLPPIEIAGPEVDLAGIKEYSAGGVLMAVTNAEQRLDEANRTAGRNVLLSQARDKLPMNLAREASRAAIERSFAMPLKAAGINAQVKARFADEGR